ncbi:MAG TPA: peptidase S1, partial [Casimicrobiaceae bacterium]|nr:peptidase S1 [Casimicrobiaceae bacterium]
MPTMKKTPLYSRSRRPADAPEAGPDAAPPRVAAAPTRRSRLAALLTRHERKVWALALAVLAIALWYGNPALRMKAPLTMEQIDAAMRQSIEDKPLLSPATRAYEAIFPSVVRVVGLMTEGDDGSDDKE